MMSRENKIEKAVELLNNESKTVFIDLGTTLDALVSVNQQDAFNASSKADHTFRAARFITTVILLIAIFLSVILAGILGRYVTTPVRQLEIAAKSVADGNLDIQLEVVSEDEIGSLSSSFNQMALSLSEAREKTTQQAERLQSQHEDLQHAFNQLELKSSELEQKNIELEDALQKLGEAQEQLIIKEKMASLGHLVAGIAHEINNPIGAVNSAVDNMKRAINKIKLYLSAGKTLEQIKKNVRFQKTFELLEDNSVVTVMASKRISRIVKSLKNFARLDEADFQKADVHEGLDSTLTLVHHELKNKVEVIKNYGKLPLIYCFPNELNQVFMNLFVNAAQAIREKGKITISTKKDKKHVDIKIADTGSGIPKEKLKNIFDPGFTTKGVGVGTGLGLSISYNIIKKHDGEIEVKSQVGKGTEFTIKLPIEQQRRTIKI
jgi:two-component system NtrC family sensor kinase